MSLPVHSNMDMVREIIHELTWPRLVGFALIMASAFMLWFWAIQRHDQWLMEQFGNQPEPSQVLGP